MGTLLVNGRFSLVDWRREGARIGQHSNCEVPKAIYGNLKFIFVVFFARYPYTDFVFRISKKQFREVT